MSAKIGYEAIKYIFTKALTKKGAHGITRIPGKAYDMRMKQLVDAMATKMRDLGYDVNKVTEKEVKGLLDSAEALEKQKLKQTDTLIKKRTEDILDEAGITSEGVIDESGRAWDFSKKDRPFSGWKPKVVETKVDLFATEKEFVSDLYSMNQNFIKNDPLFNLELATKLRNPGVKTYGWTPSGDKSKLLSPKQRQTALDKLKEIMKHDTYQAQHAEELGYVDLTDDIFTIEKAEGGRIGMAGGGALFKFIERLFIKASNDIRLGKGKWKGLDPKQIAVQHDNLTKKMIEWQKTGKTVGLEEYFGVDPHTAFIGARDKAKRLGIKKDFKKQEVQGQMDELIKKRTEDILDEAGVTSEGVSKTRTTDDFVKEAYDEIAGGSGFSGDYKYDADILADSIAEVQGKVYADLSDLERSGIYDQALKRVTKDLKAKMDFKKNLKDVEQKIELQMFDPKDRKPNASGGRVPLMYGGDPGFAFEYGGSWADWHDQHRSQMPVEQYIKTKLPKDRLPFREMQSGGLAYMLGEPTYSAGGNVGRAPWLKPTGQRPPQPQPQGSAPGGGRPDPMKAPRGLPSLAPRTMDPQYMQQQRMQQMMMGQQGQPRMGMEEGGMTQLILSIFRIKLF